MFSFFSCDFGIKENEETNSKEYFTVKGSCSIQGAIPSDLFPEKSIKQNEQRTVVPKIETDVITVIFESETGETKTAEVVDKDGVLNFEVELPAGKWTVKAQGKKSDVVIIKSESCQIELSAENKSANVALVLKPTQSDIGKGTFKFSFGQNHTKVSGMKYTYKKNGATELEHTGEIDNFSDQKNIELSSGVYTFRFDFYSDIECIGELLYSFTEVVNIFDGLTTDTWVGAGEYIKDGKICITDNMINQFISTTVYVSEFGNDSNLGTFFVPVKTIQKAVDKVIAMNVVTASSEENPYKILLLSDIETSTDDSFENNNNALVNIDLSSASENPLYLTISNYGDGNATINANRTDSNTGRVMYIGENANVTLENLKITGGYLADDTNNKGSGLYILNNGSTVKIKNCEISNNTIKNSSGAGICVGYNSSSVADLSLSIENSKINNNRIEHDNDVVTFSGAGIQIENVAANIIIKDSEISSNIIDQKNTTENNPSAQGIGFWLGSKATTTISSTSINNNEVENPKENNNNAGGGIYIKGGKLTINDGTEIINNKSTNGGGLYLCPNANDNGGNLLELSNCTISGNTATSSGGGILFCPTHNSNDDMITTLNLSNCTISSNTANQKGGGVYSYGKNPKVILDACSITDNSLGYESYNGNAFGGGLCIESGSVIMKDGSISENKCTSTGSSYGGGVYVSDGTFSMEGDAVVDSSNDVYLKTGKTITISGELTSDPVATITPENYAEDVDEPVLATDNGITLSEQFEKFNVTQRSEFETKITDTGFLKNTLKGTAILTKELYDICSTINVSSAAGMNAISNLSQTENEEKDFAGKTIFLENNVELNSNYVPIKTFSGVFDGNNKTISGLTTEGKNYNYYVPDGKALFNEVKDAGAEIKNLTVKGTAFCAGIAWTLTEDAKISYCTNMVNVTNSNDSPVGGIVSELNNGGIIENCINKGIIIGTRFVGGIVGEMAKSIPKDVEISQKFTVVANCANKKNVSVKGTRFYPDTSIGGICGSFNYGTIYNSYNIGDVTIDENSSYGENTEKTSEHLGGIVGVCWGTNIEGIINCYNSGEISSNSSSSNYEIEKRIGGILGARTATTQEIITYPKFVNTVNNDVATFVFGNIEFSNNSVDVDITNNFYKNNAPSPNSSSYVSSFADNIVAAINTLNEYSTESNGKYLKWKEDNGNIVFSEEISDNQGITP